MLHQSCIFMNYHLSNIIKIPYNVIAQLYAPTSQLKHLVYKHFSIKYAINSIQNITNTFQKFEVQEYCFYVHALCIHLPLKKNMEKKSKNREKFKLFCQYKTLIYDFLETATKAFLSYFCSVGLC